jgi:3,5-epimerase/4-reductase
MYQFNNKVLNVRIRMPMVAEQHPLNLIMKLTKYELICSNPNSMTVLPELLPIMINKYVQKKRYRHN